MEGTQSADHRVSVVGDNTIDRYVGKANVEYVGGNALNVAIHLSRLGLSSSYFGAIANDNNGQKVTRALMENLVDIAGLVLLPGETAVTQIRLAVDGDRIFEQEDFGVTAEYFPDQSTVRRIASANWVHIGMLGQASRLRASIAAQGLPTIVSQDCSVASGHEYLDVAFFSSGGDKRAAMDLARDAISNGVKLAVVTRGDQETIAYDGTIWWEQTPLPIQVVDTTGAGDSFIAGFISARIRGIDIEGALAQGARIAAYTCQHFGGFPQSRTT